MDIVLDVKSYLLMANVKAYRHDPFKCIYEKFSSHSLLFSSSSLSMAYVFMKVITMQILIDIGFFWFGLCDMKCCIKLVT